MQIGVFAKSFEGDRPATVLAASRDAGFSIVQYNMACSGLGSLPGTISEDTALNKTYPAIRARQEASVLERCMKSAVHARQEVLVVARTFHAVFHEFHGLHAVHVRQVLAKNPNSLQVALVHQQIFTPRP